MLPFSNQEIFPSPYTGLVPNYNFPHQVYPYNFNDQSTFLYNYSSPKYTSPPNIGQNYAIFSPPKKLGKPYTVANKTNENQQYNHFIVPKNTKANYKYPKIRIKTHNNKNRDLNAYKYSDNNRNNSPIQLNDHNPINTKEKDNAESIVTGFFQKQIQTEENLKIVNISTKVEPEAQLPIITIHQEEINEKKPSNFKLTASNTDLKSEYECSGKNIPPITIQKFGGFFTETNQKKEIPNNEICPLEDEKNHEINQKSIKVAGINGPIITSEILNNTLSLKDQLQISHEKNEIRNIGRNDFKKQALNFQKIEPATGENSNVLYSNSNLSSDSIENLHNQNSIKVSYGLFGDQPNSKQNKEESKCLLNDSKNINASYILI